MVCEVYLFTTGMVMVFDERGDQVPDLQGKLDDVRAAILETTASNPDVEFWHARWSVYQEMITREDFEAWPSGVE